ncbi:MAG TPA: DUF1775 domain-containing protein [Acidimicrobiia bacterium]|nr:DUF1775 domain-containing protein [Acidimicrobiia bacterium]
MRVGIGRRRTVLAAAVIAFLAFAPTGAAHTETDHVALPAGGTGTLVLRPTHGCDTAGTVEVAVRAPVEGAVAGDVAGWESSSAPDGQGNTVLTWTGGLLPADTPGAFPVEFEVPGTVGELLVFPAIQTCENGDELAWIDGDPESQYPAPRILVLPAGSAPAGSLDEVAPDAPGRDQLVAVVDVDNPSPTTTTPAPTTTTAAPTSTTVAPPPTTQPEAAEDSGASDTSDGPGLVVPALIVVGAVVVFVVVRRRP